jgi:hypothetical protein
VAAGQAGRREAHSSQVNNGRGSQAPGRSRRDDERPERRSTRYGPAFISDEAEERHYLDTLQDPMAEPDAQASARMELARLLEARGELDEAIQLYQENIWAGIRTPATYARLAAAYRARGRDDLADSTLEQIRRNGGAAETRRQPVGSDQDRRTAQASPLANDRPTGRMAVANRAGTATSRVLPAATPRTRTARPQTSRSPRGAVHPGYQGTAGGSDLRDDGLQFLRQVAAPFLAAQAGRRTLIASTIIIPVVAGLVIVGMLMMSAARSRTAAPAPAPTAAPVATVAPTILPTPAIPAALSQPPASTTLIVADVGQDGLSLRKQPGSTDRIKVWPEGTQLTDLGQQTDVGGKTWRQVRAPDGAVGWAASDFLVDPASRMPPTAAAGASSPQAGPAFASGGLGLSRAQWEQIHGQPSKVSIFLEYNDGQLVVGLSNDNIWHLERIWSSKDAVSLEDARDDVRGYLPNDAQLTQSIDRGDGRLVDLYTSASLTPRFGPTAWNGGQPGTFAIQYRYRNVDDHHVTSAMFRLGDQAF